MRGHGFFLRVRLKWVVGKFVEMVVLIYSIGWKDALHNQVIIMEQLLAGKI